MFLVGNTTQLPIRDYSIRLVWADPPTNRGMNEGSSCDTLTISQYETFASEWLYHAVRCMLPDSWLVICLYSKLRYFYENLIYQRVKNWNVGLTLEFDHEVIWDYNFGRYTNKRFVPSHDNILVFKKGNPEFYWQKVAIPSYRLLVGDSRADYRGRTPSSVWHIPRTPGNDKGRMYLEDTYRRSCQPLLLCERFIKSMTIREDVVLDLFCGSGTMAMACARLGRMCVSTDICEHYVKEAETRFKKEPFRIFMEEM